MPKSNNGSINSVLPEDIPIHGWYTFVLSYPPHLVRQYLTKFGAQEGCLVLDPFCGTGTTPVECKKHAMRTIGIEPNHMASFASRTKLNWQIPPGVFLEECRRIARIAEQDTEATGIDVHQDLPLFQHEPVAVESLRDLSPDQWRVLSPAFISPLPLHRTLILLDVIRRQPRTAWTEHQELAVAKALVSGIGNVAFGPEVGASAPKADAPVTHLWLRECERMADDLSKISCKLVDVPSQILQADARSIALADSDDKIDFVITSPPYPNEKDYTRTTRLESVILGFIRNKQDLRQLKQSLLRSNTRNVFIADEDDRWARQFASITELANAIETRRIELGKTSGFEKLYHRVVLLYFGGMRRHLESLKPSLRAGAKLAYVVGDQMSYFRIPIRTGQLLAEIADSLGYRVESIDLWRTRLATATSEWLREEVVVLSFPRN